MTLSSKTTSRTFRFKELYRSKQVKDARHQARMVVLDWVCPASVPLCPT